MTSTTALITRVTSSGEVDEVGEAGEPGDFEEPQPAPSVTNSARAAETRASEDAMRIWP